MNNKTKLQTNNADLTTALATIQSLPMADDVKHGLYIWAKYDYEQVNIPEGAKIIFVSPWIGSTGVNTHATIQSDNVDVDLLSTDDFLGATGKTPFGDNVVFDVSSHKFNANSTDIGYTYDDAKQIFILEDNGSYYNNTRYTLGYVNLVGGRRFDINFNEYVIADYRDKYPDDGEQDGYYYQKLHAENATEYGIFFNASDSNGNPVDVKIVQKDISKLLYRTSATYAYMFNNLKRLDIIATNIYDSAFGFALYNANEPFKMRLKCYHIGLEAFLGLCAGSNSNCSVWISKDCTTIDATTYSNGPFQGAAGKTKLYCEVGTKPSGWGPYWYYYNAAGYLTVTWGVTESRFAELGNV